jgi:hypothetical protein
VCGVLGCSVLKVMKRGVWVRLEEVDWGWLERFGDTPIGVNDVVDDDGVVFAVSAEFADEEVLLEEGVLVPEEERVMRWRLGFRSDVGLLGGSDSAEGGESSSAPSRSLSLSSSSLSSRPLG